MSTTSNPMLKDMEDHYVNYNYLKQEHSVLAAKGRSAAEVKEIYDAATAIWDSDPSRFPIAANEARPVFFSKVASICNMNAQSPVDHMLISFAASVGSHYIRFRDLPQYTMDETDFIRSAEERIVQRMQQSFGHLAYANPERDYHRDLDESTPAALTAASSTLPNGLNSLIGQRKRYIDPNTRAPVEFTIADFGTSELLGPFYAVYYQDGTERMIPADEMDGILRICL